MTKQPPTASALADFIRNQPRRRDAAAGAADESAGGPAGELADDEGCGDFDMRIARDGTWFYHGSPIRRVELVKLFSTVLRREEDGSFWLVTPVERGRIAVEDAPFTAVELRAEGAGRDRNLTFRTNLDAEIRADADHPIRVRMDPETGEPSPYVRVKDGLDALILRPVFYELVDLAEPAEEDGGTVLGVWSGGAFFSLGAPE